jgi:lipopolysaccharide export system ATP-binding protein
VPDATCGSPSSLDEVVEPARELAAALRETGARSATIGPRTLTRRGAPAVLSVLEGARAREDLPPPRVVNDVALRLQQGEIVGLLGRTGAGRHTFYMIAG